jgi:hypothetical protein
MIIRKLAHKQSCWYVLTVVDNSTVLSEYTIEQKTKTKILASFVHGRAKGKSTIEILRAWRSWLKRISLKMKHPRGKHRGFDSRRPHHQTPNHI